MKESLDSTVYDHLRATQSRYEDLKDELSFLGRHDLAHVYFQLSRNIAEHLSSIYDGMGKSK